MNCIIQYILEVSVFPFSLFEFPKKIKTTLQFQVVAGERKLTFLLKEWVKQQLL